MRGGRGPKRGPCAVVGCKDPSFSSGQWNWLPPEEDLAGLEVELEPGAVCFCQKVDCRAAMGKVSRKRALKGHMAGVGANDPCGPSQYKVKEIKEIWGVRYAPNAAEPPSRPYPPSLAPPCACGRHANLTKMGPRARGDKLGEVRSEYIVFGDFVSHSPSSVFAPKHTVGELDTLDYLSGLLSGTVSGCVLGALGTTDLLCKSTTFETTSDLSRG